jgi:hypothetical protein
MFMELSEGITSPALLSQIAVVVVAAWLAALVSVAILPLVTVDQALADSAERARRELEARRHEELAFPPSASCRAAFGKS